MYKVLLVDDEKLFTDYLQSVIDWHAQGCEICGVAADGENALAVAHAFLRTHVRPGAFALDATAGNGHDTLFLCRLVGAAGRVLAFDVQPQAVENTNARLRENGCGQVGRAVLDSHANLAAYAAPGSVDAAVFNLGYLPGGDHGVFTTPGVSVPVKVPS